MRVITGSAKGHRLKAPKGMSTRPMLDRVKEALFSVVEGYGPIRGRVLDLYAGTGSLGIECLSRGASWADFVERSAHVCRIIAENLAHTRFSERAQIHTAPVARYLATARPQEKYAIILMDPPYADPQIETMIRTVAASRLLHDEGIYIVGHSPRVTLADQYDVFRRRKFRCLGDSCFSIYEYGTPVLADKAERRVTSTDGTDDEMLSADGVDDEAVLTDGADDEGDDGGWWTDEDAPERG